MKKLTLTIIIIITLAAFAGVFGQQYSDNNRDQNLRGSGRVNSSTLAMEFSLPLGSYPGRGINVPVSLSYSSKVWRSKYLTSQPRVNNPDNCILLEIPTYAENSASGWTSSMAVPYIQYVGWDSIYDNSGNPIASRECPDSQGSYQNAVIKRVVVHLPSGETHELRIDDTAHTYATNASPPGKNGTYYAVDGSNLQFIEDSGNSSYKLLLNDGSFYTFGTSTSSYLGGTIRKATQYTDRNGNYTQYNATNNTWTDTLGRTIAAPLDLIAPSSAGMQTYTMPGLGGGSNVVTYKFYWKKLKHTTAPESGLTDFNLDLKYTADRPSASPSGTPRPSGYLFASEWGSWVHDAGAGVFNPIVLKEIELPTGQKYKFTYNIHGEIDKVVYPTGGEETFTYGDAPSVSYLEGVAAQMNRGISNRKIYETSGDTTPYEWSYSAGVGVTRTTNPDGTKLERFMHIEPGGSLYGMVNVLSGMAYKELGFNSADQLLSQKLTHWTESTGERHPRVDHEETIVYDTSGSGVSATTKFEYEGDLSQKETPILTNKTTSYAFVAVSGGNSISPGATPSASPTPVPTSTPPTVVRSSESTYLISDSSYSGVKSYYTAQNIMGLVTVSKVKDSSGTVVSHSETKYDESGSSPGYRGNPTSSWVWDSYKGGTARSDSYPLTSTNAIKTSAVFDSYGNQTSSTDALGNTTTTTFDSTYHAFPISVTSPVPDSTNTYGSNSAFVSSATFDPTTGLPLTTTDANNLKREITYETTTLRPRYIKYYSSSNVQVGPTNETIYHDEPNNYWVKSKNQIDSSTYAESITYLDGLGRAWKAEEVNSEGNVFVEKEFDADGRVSRVSNPFRSGGTKVWTTNTYDTAGRVVSVTLPDSSTVSTEYGVSTSSPIGVTKTITDQAGKKRKGYSDASGNMTRVVEDPTSSALVTDYTFDSLGNLRKTVQGDQSRFFMHSSLGRLLYAKQVEQDTNVSLIATDPVTGNTAWSAKYEYDNNGNITKTTDAKNWYVEGTYDALNRIKARNYSDTATPDVSFYYDGKGLASVPDYSKGKTTKVTSSVSETKYMTFDEFGRTTSHRQTTDGTNYDTAYEYNLSGALVKETYPSGREVTNTLDGNGDLASTWSKKSGGISRVYLNDIVRDTAGSITSMKLGNGRFENAAYNSRQQITQIGIGSSATDSGLLKLEFKYDTTSTSYDNNGSMREQKVTVPTVGSNSGFTAIQAYTYDDLNRLTSATETVSSSQTWKQTFTYDRYGNRRFDTSGSNTTTLGSCAQTVCNPEFPTDSTNRNRFKSNQSYTYDANGSVTVNAAGERFGYDAENHQKEFFAVSNSGSTPDAVYKYDGDGKRVKKETASENTVFVYDAVGQLVAEYSNQVASVQQVSYLTADHLGSPRVTTNEIGAVTNRKDFSAFGDEVTSAQRVSGGSGNGYTADEVRKDYTGYEKDTESGLQFAQARYYNTTHGRFTSVDPMTASASIKNPQTFNRYSYVLNSPYKFVDPLGLISSSTGACGSWCSNVSGDSGYVPEDDMRRRSSMSFWVPPSGTPTAGSQSNAASQAPAQQATSGSNSTSQSQQANSVQASSNQPIFNLCAGDFSASLRAWLETLTPPTVTASLNITFGAPNLTQTPNADGSISEKWELPINMELIDQATGKGLTGYSYKNFYSGTTLTPLPTQVAVDSIVELQRLTIDGPNGNDGVKLTSVDEEGNRYEQKRYQVDVISGQTKTSIKFVVRSEPDQLPRITLGPIPATIVLPRN